MTGPERPPGVVDPGVIDPDLVDRLTTVGLEPRDASGPPAPDVVVLDESAARAILASPPHEGLVCLAGGALAAGVIDADEPARRLLEQAWATCLARVVQLDGVLVEVCASFRRAGIATRVLKGAALAHLDERDPAWRSYGDVDVLVPPDALLAALDLAEAIGFRPEIDPVGRAWAARHAKSVTLHDGQGVELDLHRQLAAGPFGSRLDTPALFADGHPFVVGGQPLVALGDDHRFLHATYHAALGGIRGARHRRDVLVLAAARTPDVVAQRRHEGWSPAVVAEAIAWADPSGRWLGEDWHAWAAAWNAMPTSDQRLLRSYDGSFADLARAEVRATRGVLPKVSYAGAILWPSRSHLRARNQTRVGHLKRLASGLPGRVIPR